VVHFFHLCQSIGKFSDFFIWSEVERRRTGQVGGGGDIFCLWSGSCTYSISRAFNLGSRCRCLLVVRRRSSNNRLGRTYRDGLWESCHQSFDGISGELLQRDLPDGVWGVGPVARIDRFSLTTGSIPTESAGPVLVESPVDGSRLIAFFTFEQLVVMSKDMGRDSCPIDAGSRG